MTTLTRDQRMETRIDALRCLQVESVPARAARALRRLGVHPDIAAECDALAIEFAGRDDYERDQACAALGRKLAHAFGL